MNRKLKITDPTGSLETRGIVDSVASWHMDTMMKELVRRVNEKFEIQLKEYLLKNLKRLGYVFESEEVFYDFIKSRVTRLDFKDRPHYHEFRLDHSTDIGHSSGHFIGSYSDTLDMEFDEGKVNITMGRNIHDTVHDKW